MALKNLKSVFGDISKFKNLRKTIHATEDNTALPEYTKFDRVGNELVKKSGKLKKLKTKLDSSPIITQTRGPGGNDPVDTSPDVEPVPWWSVDTSNLNIDGTPSFDTTSLSDIYINFATEADSSGNISPDTTVLGGNWNAATGAWNLVNFNPLFQAALGSNPSLGDIFQIPSTMLLTSGAFYDASVYYINSQRGDVLAIDAQINKFGRLGEKFNKLADKIGMPGIKIPNINLSAEFDELNPFKDRDVIYQNEVFELFKPNVPTDQDAGEVSTDGSYFGETQYKNPYRGVAFQVLGDKNKAGGIIDTTYQHGVDNFVDIDLRNPFREWRSGHIKFKNPEFSGKMKDFVGSLNLSFLGKLPLIDLSNFNLGGFGGNFQNMNDWIKKLHESFGGFGLPDFDFPKLSGFGNKIKLSKLFPKFNFSLPDFNLPSFGGLDFSSLGDGGFLSGVANAVGNVIGNIGQGIGNFLGKIKISPFKGKLSGMASGFVSNLKSLNPIESLRLPGLKLQNPFDVNISDFGGVGKLVGNQPRSLTSTITQRKVHPGNNTEEAIEENVQIGPYATIGKKYWNGAPYYPQNMDQQNGGDLHTTIGMVPGFKSLNVYGEDNFVESEQYGMPFYFYDLRDNTYIIFRASIEGLTEQLSPSWASENYVGRSEPVYIYERTERTIDFSLKLFAQSALELDAIYSKMRRLTSLCYPEYAPDYMINTTGGPNTYSSRVGSAGKYRMKPPLTRLRIGELFGRHTTEEEAEILPSKNDVLGFLKSLSYSVPETSPWEYRKGQRVPKHVVATVSYQVIHDTPPEKNTGFYGYSGTNVV